MRKLFLLFSVATILIITIVYYSFIKTETNNNLYIQEKGITQSPISIDILSDTVSLVKLPYTIYTRPSLINGQLYLPINEKAEYLNKIIKYDLNSKKTSSVFESPFKDSTINNVMANENWVTWENSDITGKNSTIYALNINTNKVKKIFETDTDIIKINVPYLYNDYVSWVNVSNGKPEVVLYDLNNDVQKTIARINSFSLYNNFIHIENDELVWTDSIEGNGYYYVYDIIKNKKDSYKAPQPFPGYGQIMENKIFSINFNDPNRWISQSFGYFDLASKKFTAVDVRTSYINRFATGKNNLAIIDSEQKLHVYSIQNNKLQKVNITGAPLKVDTIDFSYNGELIAGYTDNQSIFLYLINVKME